MSLRSAPSGTVTFLFTDIEGSTKIWEAHPDAMAVSLARHDALMRVAIDACGGHIFKTIGDAFCAAFSTATDALAAMLAAQRALTSEPWPQETPLKVRMAMHTGAVESRDDDYFGPPVNRVARLLSVAHGGQTLLSVVTQELVRDNLPPGASLRSLGEHRLKDLGRPEIVFQLLHPDLPDDFPPLRSLSNPELKHNLPRQVTSFVGREKEIGDVRSLLANTALLTLTGSGGCGKTRLAQRVADDLLNGMDDGVWFVEFASLADPNLVPSTVASVLNLKEEPGRPLLQTLTDRLKAKHLLLLLDNCEHLIDACAQLADAVLRNCPHVLILATSREGLGISGEQTYRVPSLSLPDPTEPQTLETLGQYEAVRLFMDRALQVQPNFAVTDQNALALASVCHRLDGIPLAIELAAARARSLTVEDINARLDQRFRLLTGGSRAGLPRQQTLRSLIDWSYELLTEAEKALLCRLSVFAGGWTLEAAEDVCAGEPIEAWEMLDLLTSLSDKSLIVPDTEGGTAHYRLLESVRHYAGDRLAEGGDEAAWRDRHLRYFVRFAEQAEPELNGRGQQEWLGFLNQEHDNVRAALGWALRQQEGESMARIVAALDMFWVITSRFVEGDGWSSRVLLSDSSIPPLLRSRVLEGGVLLAFFQGNDAEAAVRAQECCRTAREAGDPWQLALALFAQGISAVHTDRLEEALAAGEEGMRLAEALGDPFLIGRHHVLKALHAWLRGRYGDARNAFGQVVDISRRVGDDWHLGISLANQAFVARLDGDPTEAASLHAEGITLCGEIGDRRGISWHLLGMAGVHLDLGHPLVAAQLLGAVASLSARVGVQLPLHQRQYRDAVAEAVREQLGPVGFDSAWQTGGLLSFEQAIDLAARSAEL